MPPQRAMVCAVCDKIGRPPEGRNAMPEFWRRVTVSNPHSLRKRGETGIVCSKGCAARFVTERWEAEVLAA